MQSNISPKNIERIEELAAIEDAEFQELRTLVLHIAALQPRMRGRWKKIRLKHASLNQQISDSGIFGYLLDEYYCKLTLDDD